MRRKPEPIPADPSDPEDFSVDAEGVARGLLARQVRLLRHESGLSEQGFADRHGLDVSVLRDWEALRATPPLYAVAFLRAAVRGDAPIAALDALRGEGA